MTKRKYRTDEERLSLIQECRLSGLMKHPVPVPGKNDEEINFREKSVGYTETRQTISHMRSQMRESRASGSVEGRNLQKLRLLNPTKSTNLANALYDKAFDKGLVTLNKKHQVVISAKLKDSDMDKATKTWLMGYAGHLISFPDKFLPGKQFIEYHNDMIFQK